MEAALSSGLVMLSGVVSPLMWACRLARWLGQRAGVAVRVRWRG
jgi:hypothetical protein